MSIFKQYDVRGKYPQEINEKVIKKIVQVLIKKYKAKKIMLGHDMRKSSDVLSRVFVKSAVKAGADVLNIRLASVGVFAFAQNKYKTDLAVYLTASHIGRNYNGVKILNKNGTALHGNDLQEIKAKIDSTVIDVKSKSGQEKNIDIMPQYLDWLFAQINIKKLKFLNIILDASNGAIAPVASASLSTLPGEFMKINFGLQDKFIDHSLDPLKKDSHKQIKKLIKQELSDLGVLWDGDGDRIVFFDETGKFVHPYYINILLSKIMLIKYSNALILHDNRLKLGLEKEIIKSSGNLKIIKSGWPNFISKMQKYSAVFSCETSAHYYFCVNKNAIADGILPLLLIIEYLSENNISLSQAVSEFTEKYFTTHEINFKDIDFKNACAKLQMHFKNIQPLFLDGLSFTTENWHMNFRESQTEPDLVRLNIEANSRKLLVNKKREILDIIKN
ncbi:hypothetical protein CL633_03540 [bacterium]|nr:hypothetical protein [bacterium]|tara:strand:- start:35821 stop:37155 length:1335 start_codon:yes stop_codon:yes gene_type:complete